MQKLNHKVSHADVATALSGIGVFLLPSDGSLLELPVPPAEGALLLRLALQPPACAAPGSSARGTPGPTLAHRHPPPPPTHPPTPTLTYTHLLMHCRWKAWVQTPQTTGESSPGYLPSGGQPSKGMRQMPHTSSPAHQDGRAIEGERCRVSGATGMRAEGKRRRVAAAVGGGKQRQ